MKRRNLILVGAGLILGAAAVGYVALPSGTKALTIDAAKTELLNYASKNIAHTGRWTPAQVFAHLAQSIEYSMSGFPENKSALFQKTAGAAAFAVFNSKGAMRHSLTEPIPGAPSLANETDTNTALARLVKSLDAFQTYSGALKPHFAYGALDKRAYERAHAMHIYNHLPELKIA